MFCRTATLIYIRERMYFLFKLAMVSVFTESSMALGYSELISITNDKLRSQICDMEVFVEDSRLN